MNSKKEMLRGIVGNGSVLDDPETLGAYSRDESFAIQIKPSFVVRPGKVEEIQKIVKWANRTQTPLVPVSSGPPHFHGDTVPGAADAVMIDLSLMNRVIRIDRKNRMVLIEPGVTYSQLQPQLSKEGLRLSMPLLPRANKSVIASLLEREPTLNPRFQWAVLDPLRCLEVVWGNGDLFRTGEAGNRCSLEEEWGMQLAQVMPTGPGQTDFYKLVSAAQGSMGIVTWASIKCEVLPELHKLFFVTAQSLESVTDFVYKILRLRFGDELLLLNGVNMASILGDSVEQIIELKEKLPKWIVAVGVAGRRWLPRERVDFQEKDIADIAQQYGLRLKRSISGAGAGYEIEKLLSPSRDPFWKLTGRGGCQDLFFLTTLNKTNEFVKAFYPIAEAYGYPFSEIGVYIQPVHQGAACHCEFSLPFDPENSSEVARIQELFLRASEELLSHGAFFSRPYGIWSNMTYNRDAQTTIALRKIKEIFDPNNVMNPGKLCF